MDKIIGIYKITNPKGKIYIGQSTNVYDRWNKGHKYSHSKKTGVGKKLKNSLKKYGWECHVFEIIEECTIEQLEEKEIYWINYYNTYKNGLNSQIGGFTGYHNDEWKYNQSKNNKGTKRPTLKGKKRPDHSIFLKENGSGLSYERTQTHKENLSIMMKEIWSYKKKEIGEKISKNKMNKGIKPIICDTLFGMEFKSLKEASELLGLNKGNICEILKGNRIHIKGFTFRYKK
jgi:group I intron endonuclease